MFLLYGELFIYLAKRNVLYCAKILVALPVLDTHEKINRQFLHCALLQGHVNEYNFSIDLFL